MRTPEEVAVSYLPGAVRIAPNAENSGDLDSARRIVAYCSVGLRSARLARRLRAAGFDAANLDGSLFRWANEGRPLVRLGEDGVAERVEEAHPYNALWGALLDRHLHSTQSG